MKLPLYLRCPDPPEQTMNREMRILSDGLEALAFFEHLKRSRKNYVQRMIDQAAPLGRIGQ